jgi:hypothetical protein
MANVKMTPSNYDDILDDMATNTGSARTDNFYFSPTELNEISIRQLGWEKNVVLTIQQVDSFVSKVNFSDILNS